ncbi:MAG: hypothetical protein S4CHLAM45_07670 [Chlamydiales bacterium]|nr:hypothetical protein [Chlamydiales bacterium]MCH9620023.1 hypothetical protein [Chlamydiales bacterium]MCH9622874.1 hypothetical protein [Chlamydiales bacterium]
MKLDLTPFLHLEHHFLERQHNHPWVSACICGNIQKFPFRLASNKTGSIKQDYNYLPQNLPQGWPSCTGQQTPTYLLNIPSTGEVSKILNLLKTEGFAYSSEASKKEMKERVCVVIGLNRPYSLDRCRNVSFLQMIYTLPIIEGIAYRVFGFFWGPIWEIHSCKGKHLYDVKKAYRLLKALSKTHALDVLKLMENGAALRSQVPYQKVRERIKDNVASSAFATYLENKAPKSPIYFGVMDSDSQGLRSEEVGLFSRIDGAIIGQGTPSVVTCGYRVNEPGRPLLEIGVKLDMAVRAAMNQIIPYSPYFPEPGSFFCVRRPPGSHFLKQLSFSGSGAGLECRRLIQNGRDQKLFDDQAVFLPSGGPLTTTPDRMKTKTSQSPPSKGKQKGFLRALRGISQTHILPKQWAENLYVVLELKCERITDATTPIMKIFTLFDPISRMLGMSGRYYSGYFDTVIKEYGRPLTKAEAEMLEKESNKLLDLGMANAELQLVVKAASASGEAIFEILSKSEDSLQN